jgi:hypothetical protein
MSPLGRVSPTQQTCTRIAAHGRLVSIADLWLKGSYSIGPRWTAAPSRTFSVDLHHRRVVFASKPIGARRREKIGAQLPRSAMESPKPCPSRARCRDPRRPIAACNRRPGCAAPGSGNIEEEPGLLTIILVKRGTLGASAQAVVRTSAPREGVRSDCVRDGSKARPGLGHPPCPRTPDQGRACSGSISSFSTVRTVRAVLI